MDINNESFEYLKKELISLEKEGGLAPSFVFKRKPELIKLSYELFGSYIKALGVLNLNYKENIKGKKYTDRYLLDFLLEISKKEEFSPYYVQKEHKKIYKALCHRFKNLKNVFCIVGLDYNSSKQQKSWSKSEIRKELRKFFRGNKKTLINLSKEKKNLYKACSWHFDSVKEAIEYSGLNYNDCLLYSEITREELIDFIKNKSDEELSFNVFQRNNCRFYAASIKYFGSYECAIKESGKNYEDIKMRTSWCKEKIKSKVKLLIESGKFSISEMRTIDSKLDSAVTTYFSGYKNLLKEMEKEETYFLKNKIKEEYIKHFKWDKEDIIKALLEMKNKECNLNSQNMYYENRSLHRACRHYFGSYKKALVSAGIDYKKIVRDEDAYWGLEFQKLLGKIFKELGIKVIENKNINGLMPDFRLENDVWIDAKLSQWTSSIDNTIKKYKDHCSELIIVYLRGYSDETVRDDGVKVVSVYKYLSDLGIDENHIVYEWLSNLDKNISN